MSERASVGQGRLVRIKRVASSQCVASVIRRSYTPTASGQVLPTPDRSISAVPAETGCPTVVVLEAAAHGRARRAYRCVFWSPRALRVEGRAPRPPPESAISRSLSGVRCVSLCLENAKAPGGLQPP